MSERPYDGQSFFMRNDSRRSTGNYPMNYQRPQDFQQNRHSFGDNSYKSQGVSYRNDIQDRYYNASPQDQYIHSHRFGNDAWDYSTSHQSLTRNWNNRPGPSTSQDRTLATRMFEPSDSWKQSHNDGSFRQERYRETSRYYSDQYRHNGRSPHYNDRSFRRNNDRYSPSRGSYHRINRNEGRYSPSVSVRRTDSYRPRSNSSRSPSFYTRNSSDRSSRSRSHSRNRSRRSDRISSSRSRSRESSIRRFSHSRSRSRSFQSRGRSSIRRSRSRSRFRTHSRSASRSSIASSRASDREVAPRNASLPADSKHATAKIDASSISETVVTAELPSISVPETDFTATTAVSSAPEAPESSLDGNEANASKTSPLKVETPPTKSASPAVEPESPLSLRPVPMIDFTMDDIPSLNGAKTIGEALRVVVMTRLLCDRQTRQERVDPVLESNRMRFALKSRSSTTADELVKEFHQRHRQDIQIGIFPMIREALVKRLEDRHAKIQEKNERLRREYLAHHRKWLAHCQALDDAVKPIPVEEAPPTTSRMTRRSTALGMLGDAVRSDLEMEQIIASLGIDEATDPTYLSAKNHATIPDMISVSQGRVDCLYEDNNLLVRDTEEFFAPHTGICDWTEKEKEIFLDKYAAFPKQFGIIADYLPHKTASQCVAYYYLHKKYLIDFRKVVSQYAPNKRRRRRTSKMKGNALLADIRQHDAEVGAGKGRTGKSRAIEPRTRLSNRKPSTEQSPTTTPTPEPESRPKRRRILTSTSRAPLADDDDETDSERRATKRVKRSRKPKSAPTVVEDESPSDQWEDKEKVLFVKLIAQYGQDFQRIWSHLSEAGFKPDLECYPKTVAQLESYYKRNAVELEAKAQQLRNADRSGIAARDLDCDSKSLAISDTFCPDTVCNFNPSSASCPAYAPAYIPP